MTSSENIRALIFVALALIGCLIRTYIRTANGEKEDEVHFWSSSFSQLQQQHEQEQAREERSSQKEKDREGDNLSSSTTSSGEVSRSVSAMPAQQPRFADFRQCTYAVATTLEDSSALASDQEGSVIEDAYEDWAAMHHARGACSEDAEASIDKLIQQRTFGSLKQGQRPPQLKDLPHLDSLGISGSSTPTIWTAHFPAAQLRPY